MTMLSSPSVLDDSTVVRIYGVRAANLLADMLRIADDAAALVARGRYVYDTEAMARNAAQGLLMMFGHAVAHLPQAFTDDYPDAPWRQLASLRSLPVDDDGLGVDDDFAWSTLAFRVSRDAAYVRAIVTALD